MAPAHDNALATSGPKQPILRLSPKEAVSLEEKIGELAAHLQAATYRLLQLLARYDAGGVWAERGFVSCASWLSWYTSIDLGACREKVRVARRLAELPQISAALERAEVSYSKVRAMTRVATEENEGDLLGVARHGTTAHVERLVRAYRDCDPDETMSRAQRQHDGRYLRLSYDEHGALRVSGKLPPDLGAKLIAAVNAAGDVVRSENPSQKLGAEQCRADALVRIADCALASDNTGALAGRRAADTQQVVLHVDEVALTKAPLSEAAPANGSGHQTSETAVLERCELKDGPRVSAETARRLACDCSVVEVHVEPRRARRRRAEPGRAVTGKDVGSATEGRARRVVSGPLRRALSAQQPVCQFPGCGHTRFLEAHHIVHWADGGETSLQNSCHLCSFHHRFVHEGGYRVRRDAAGGFEFLAPNGQAMKRRPPPMVLDDEAMERLIQMQEGLELSHESIGRWNGERFDLDWALPSVALPPRRYAQLSPG